MNLSYCKASLFTAVDASPLIVEAAGNLGKQCDVKLNSTVSISEVMNLLSEESDPGARNLKNLQYRRSYIGSLLLPKKY